jgi:5-methylcytosine-specific restriction protein A
MPTLQTKQANASRPDSSNSRQERQKIYNTQRWVRLRKEILMRYPVCQRCNSKLSEHVHHIDSFMNYTGITRVSVAYDSRNLQALCAECHQLMHNSRESV